MRTRAATLADGPRAVISQDMTRPPATREALAWAMRGAPTTVVQLGGPSDLTAGLLELCAGTVMVAGAEPLGQRPAPGAALVACAPTALPVSSNSIDLVVLPHDAREPVDPRVASEAARVLRPGGHLALLTGLRDVRIPWVGRLEAAIADPRKVRDHATDLLRIEGYDAVELGSFRVWETHSRASLRGQVGALPHVRRLRDAERRSLLTRVDEVYDASAPRAAREVRVPSTTHCYLARAVSTGEVRAEPEAGTVLIDFR